MDLQILLQKNGMSLMIKITQNMVKEMENDSSIKFETKIIKSNLCDYSDAFILVTGDITVVGINADTNVAIKNCAPFTRSVTQYKWWTNWYCWKSWHHNAYVQFDWA